MIYDKLPPSDMEMIDAPLIFRRAPAPPAPVRKGLVACLRKLWAPKARIEGKAPTSR